MLCYDKSAVDFCQLGPTPPGLPTMVVGTLSSFMSRIGISASSSGESESKNDEKCWGLCQVFSR